MKRTIILAALLICLPIVFSYEYNWPEGTDGQISNNPDDYIIWWNGDVVAPSQHITKGYLYSNSDLVTIDQGIARFEHPFENWYLNSSEPITSGTLTFIVDIIKGEGTEWLKVTTMPDQCGAEWFERSGEGTYDYYDSNVYLTVDFKGDFSEHNYTFMKSLNLSNDMVKYRMYYMENGTEIPEARVDWFSYTYRPCNNIAGVYPQTGDSSSKNWIGGIRAFKGYDYPKPTQPNNPHILFYIITALLALIMITILIFKFRKKSDIK